VDQGDGSSQLTSWFLAVLQGTAVTARLLALRKESSCPSSFCQIERLPPVVYVVLNKEVGPPALLTAIINVLTAIFFYLLPHKASRRESSVFYGSGFSYRVHVLTLITLDVSGFSDSVRVGDK
jgi:hypothetical protein